MRAIIAALAFVGLVGATAQASDMEGRGRILNTDGASCWFTQTVEKRTAAFLGPAPGQVAIMIFDDPGCMAEITEDGYDLAAVFNRNRIAGRIAVLVRGTWVQDWVEYAPDERNQPGIMQKTGECMMAEDLPATAIAINFVSNGASITRVEYATAFGCGDPL